jgi:hypothetical protein
MKQIRKRDLPVKICQVCEKPFAWRKKWEKVWEDVKYCSDKCRNNKSKNNVNGDDFPPLIKNRN